MISYQVYTPAFAGAYIEATCTDIDEMPVTGIVVGSKAHEFDPSTGVVTEYMYDPSSMAWVEVVQAESDDTEPGSDET